MNAAWLASAMLALVLLQVAAESARPDYPPRRILTLAPHATELVLALGLESRLVAVAPFDGYPETLDRLPRLGGLGGLDRERLLALEPDLVIAWRSGNRPGDLRWLARSGIPLFLSEPASLPAIGQELERLGRLLGVPEQGRQAATRFRQRLESACPGRRHARPLATFWALWLAPPMTVGGHHWLNEVMARAGLRNLFADLSRGVVTVTTESLLARAPELLVITAPGEPVPPWPASRTTVLRADATLGRPGPRIVEGLARLCQAVSGISNRVDGAGDGT